MSRKKSSIIQDIVKETRVKAEDHFDFLNEQTETYLNKLLRAIKGL